MSIPLNRLYHYIECLVKDIHSDHTIISRFWPHGSKNINDLRPLTPLKDWQSTVTATHLYCHDQEPLRFDYYQTQKWTPWPGPWAELLSQIGLGYSKSNIDYFPCANKKSLLLHSEKRSKNLKKYQDNNLIDIYYWSHALLARDWYRYAEHINISRNAQKLFLIYNRAWSGTREYRLRFIDLIIDRKLVDQCQCSFTPTDSDIHYQQHVFSNSVWKPQNNLENHLPIKSVSSCSSADFDIDDYSNTSIEVVLETLFDDDRLHLTEKILRPIACAQPFILAATHGSLQYLRDYGFKTYHSVWDESYDNIVDPEQRLFAIIELMNEISCWTEQQRYQRLEQAQEIARYNKQWFFSQNFLKLITDELKDNLRTASEKFFSTTDHTDWAKRWDQWLTYPEIQNFLDTNTDPFSPTRAQYLQVLKHLKIST